MHDDARLVLDSVIRLLESEQALYHERIALGNGDNSDIVRYNLITRLKADIIDDLADHFPEVGA